MGETWPEEREKLMRELLHMAERHPIVCLDLTHYWLTTIGPTLTLYCLQAFSVQVYTDGLTKTLRVTEHKVRRHDDDFKQPYLSSRFPLCSDLHLICSHTKPFHVL